jgi:hypothetical protein
MKIPKALRNPFFPFLAIFALFVGTAMTLASLTDNKEVSRQRVGKILDATVIPNSFNEHSKTQVKTEFRSFVVLGLPEIPIGEEAEIVAFEGGRRYLAFPSGRYMIRIW